MWEQALSLENSNLGEAYTRNLQAFTRLHRRLESTERSYYRALQELRRLQTSAGDERAGAPVAPDSWPLAPDPLAPAPPSPELASFSLPRETPGATPPRPEVNKTLNKALRL